ncbi:MAG TPA: class I SAM-dependent methyltransferase [Pilimelia sp.]|nr:class I SAM-dependent methyltransferase [Pilimelia sp.]
MTDTAVLPKPRLTGGGPPARPAPDPDPRGCARGPLCEVLAAAAGGPGVRLLLAGPHGAEVVARAAATGADVTCLVRSYADRTALAERFDGGAARVRVVCGSLQTLRAEGDAARYDAVVALAGLDRLGARDGDEPGWAAALAGLSALLRPSGRLVLAAENPLGVHRLVELAPSVDDADDEWVPPGWSDETRPRTLDQLVRRLAGEGLHVGSRYAAYPRPEAPTVLLAADLAATAPDRTGAAGAPDGGGAEPNGAEPGGVPAGGSAEPGSPELGGALDAVLAAACAAGFAGTPVLTDPRQLAGAALRGGLAVELAPLWVVGAARGAGAEPALDTPAVLVADATDPPRWGVRYAVTPGPGGRWQREVVAEPAAGPAPHGCAAGPVRRDPARLAGALPAGRLLEAELVGACQRRDLPTLRRLLAGYAGWLAAHRDGRGRLAGEWVFATPRATVVDGDRFALLDPSWSLADPVPYEVALARALRGFAVDLTGGGYAHPWPAATDVDGLTVLLSGLAGADLTRAVVRQAVDVEVEIATAVRGLDPVGRAEHAARLLTADAGAPPLDVDSHRRLHQAVHRLREELAEARARVAWYEERLAAREPAPLGPGPVTGVPGAAGRRTGGPLLLVARMLRSAFGRGRRD